MLGAPFLLLDLASNGFSAAVHSPLSSALDIIYMTGWMASLVALRRIGAFGNSIAGTVIYSIQLGLLALANIYNIYDVIEPGANTDLYRTLDATWPLSNAFMLVTAGCMLRAGKLRGWHRFAPLAVSLWLPIGFALWALLDRSFGMMLFNGLYSAITWTAMGLVAVIYAEKEEKRKLVQQFLRTPEAVKLTSVRFIKEISKAPLDIYTSAN